MEVEFRNPYGITPPGSLVQILSHPIFSGTTELAIFQDHRYAFFFWNKWLQDYNHKNTPPCLVTLDWHQDLCYPCETEKEWLDNLNLTEDGDVAFFSWAKLAGNNDNHILSAAYLNLIGNIYVHCRQGKFTSDWEDEELIDKLGKVHIIKKFKTYESLEAYMLSSQETDAFFDIDLDFFTLNNPYNTGRFEEKFTYLSEDTIREMLLFKRPLINWLFNRLRGFTIATEPQHSGGLMESYKLLKMINKMYFKGKLIHPVDNCDWSHKL